MNNPQQPQMNIDFSQTTPVVCEKCGHDVFTPAMKMRKLSALLSPTGQETMIPVQAFACVECNHINEGFLPKEDQ
jgi:hypothetical protein|tara:strand:- start:513 stop:737 length:225 start_codon:yes stop_codon:yes gene_type:complete